MRTIATIATSAFVYYTATASESREATYGGEIKLINQRRADEKDVVKSPLPSEYIQSVPSSWDWREKGLMTTDLNQHIPVYCGSCWAHASTSTMADRMKILSNGTMRDVMPSIQVLLNCGTAGSCGGGDIHAVFRWIHMNSIPDVTCQQYTATDGECSDITTCMNCDPSTGCYAIKNYPKYSISE